MSHISNAVVKTVNVGFHNGFCLTVWVTVKHAGGGEQGFGGFALGGTRSAGCGDHRNQPNLAGEFLVGLLLACEVDDLSDCVGKAIRVAREDAGFSASIVAIGHILDDDKWFNPSETFKQWKAKAGGGA